MRHELQMRVKPNTDSEAPRRTKQYTDNEEPKHAKRNMKANVNAQANLHKLVASKN